MKTELIKATFTNLLFVIGVILIIVGFVRGTDTMVKSLVFDSYPLQTWEETRCEGEYMFPTPMRPVETVQDGASISSDSNQPDQQEIDRRIEKCEAALNRQRDTKQVSDIVGSFTMLVSGIVLVYVFKGFIFSSKK